MTTVSAPVTSPDTQAFKTAVREQWDRLAHRWNEHTSEIRAWLRQASDAMPAMAGIGPGASVLDVAAGAGDQTLDIAQRLGPKQRPAGRIQQRPDPGRRRRGATGGASQLRRGGVPAGTHVFSRSAARAARHAPGIASRRRHLRHGVLAAGLQPLASAS